jgi:membrane associated rhomboid family serine protease
MPDNWDFTQKPQRAGAVGQTPILTYLLLALSVVTTAAYLTGGGQPGTLWYNVGHFGFAETPGAAPWSLITTVFIHGSWLHLLFNMLWLVQIGRILEATLNPIVYLAFLVGAAAVGGGCQFLISGSTGIGMSGVVYAMFALMWAGRGLYPAWGAVATQANLRLFVGWGLFCIVATYLHILAIANGAHAGGFLFGLSVGFLFFTPRRRWVWAAPLVLLVGATVFSALRLHTLSL